MERSPNSAIAIRDVTKVFPAQDSQRPDFVALQDVSLDVNAGEFVSIIGPSGCGKTTLLKMIDGLVEYDRGEIFVGQQLVRGPGPDRAMVFQNFALLPWLSVRENVMFGLRVRGLDSTRQHEIADRFLEMVDLGSFADHYPAQLSGGMQQRVGLARAFAVDPDILLMDEPFGALDALTKNFLERDLLRIWEDSRKTVVFVTHDMSEAAFLSDRIVIMGSNPGRIVDVVEVGLPRPRSDETTSLPRFVEVEHHLWTVLQAVMTERVQEDQGSQ